MYVFLFCFRINQMIKMTIWIIWFLFDVAYTALLMYNVDYREVVLLKKITTVVLLTLLLCATLVFSVSAANLEGDAESCAEALYELELFLGTDKGFELERPMTRAEAATMLVRFLGTEKRVLSGNWKHPFTDVPEWADKYVGWLYESGLTKGVTAKLYGSQQPVTAWQYGTFIARALQDSETIPYGLITEEDIAKIDADKKFIRADAVIMSVRALGCQYTKNENFRPLADVCIERGLFTAEEFGDACFSFFAPSYVLDDDGYISLRILGIEVRKSVSGGYFVNQTIELFASDGTKCDPLVYRRDGETVSIYTMNPQSLETTLLTKRTGIQEHCYYKNLFKFGKSEIVVEMLGDLDKTTFLAIENDEVKEILSFTGGGQIQWFPVDGVNTFVDADSFVVKSFDKVYVVADNEVSIIGEWNMDVCAYIDGNIIAECRNETSVDIVLFDAKSKKKVVSYSIPDDMMEEYAPRGISRDREGYYYGEAGLYFYNKGMLIQITDKPANDFIKLDDGSYTILTHNLGKRYVGMNGFGGNAIMCIKPDGSEVYLMQENPDIADIDSMFLKDGKVHFVTAEGVGMGNYDMYTYRIEENGELTVVDFSAGRPEVMNGFTWENPAGYKDGYIKNEQERIDKLGY